MNIKKEVGINLRTIRTSKGLSQLKLESKTGLAAGTISRIEHGNVMPTLSTLHRVANALELNEEEKITLFCIG